MARDIKRDFDATTATWSTRPRFQTSVELKRVQTFAAVRVGTDDARWGLLDKGTGARVILPARPKGALAFRKYTPKTRPGQLGSFAGGRFGPVIVKKAVYGYKGIKARNFVDAALQKHGPQFGGRLEAAMDRGVLKGGMRL